MSPKLHKLRDKLHSKQCTDPIGTHPPPAPIFNEQGDFSTKALRVWAPSFCRAIVDETSQFCPTGGPSVDLGSSSLFVAAASELAVDCVPIFNLPSSRMGLTPALFVAATKSGVPVPASDLELAADWVAPQTDK